MNPVYKHTEKHQRLYNKETLHSSTCDGYQGCAYPCYKGALQWQSLLSISISWGSTDSDTPPSSWDKRIKPDKHHRCSVECSISLVYGLWKHPGELRRRETQCSGVYLGAVGGGQGGTSVHLGRFLLCPGPSAACSFLQDTYSHTR